MKNLSLLIDHVYFRTNKGKRWLQSIGSKKKSDHVELNDQDDHSGDYYDLLSQKV